MPTPKIQNLPPGAEEPLKRDKHIKLMTVIWGAPAPTTDGTDNAEYRQLWWWPPKLYGEAAEPIVGAITRMLVPKSRAKMTRFGPEAIDVARKDRGRPTEEETDWLP